MAQAEFTYQAARDPAGLGATVSIYADRPALRGEIEEDLSSVGFRCSGGGEVEALLDGAVAPLGDVVLLDCPHVDAQRMAALARLDMRVARSGAHLIVTTSLESLDSVFAVFDQSEPQILVDASRAERIVAVGRVVGEVAGARVKELSEEDRLVILRLAQQVDAIAQRLNGYDDAGGLGGVASQLGDASQSFRGFDREQAATKGKSEQVRLPDPQMVRQVIRLRQARAKFFDADLFADPVWDMLLDLTAAQSEQKQVAVTSLCIASGVPATTALRWIRQMVDSGLFERVEDNQDKRRAFISLSEKAAAGMSRYFAEVANPGMAIAA